MGIFGISLYSGDFPMDLRATVRAVARLPFDAHRLVEILCDTERQAANDPNNEEHTTFWLVLADQFAKRGIFDDEVRSKALTIIDSGEDIAMLAKLGMKGTDLRRRQKVLEEVRTRILEAPKTGKHRPLLKKPQPLIMTIGDVLVYPTCHGHSINPYFPSKDMDVVYTKDGPAPWKQTDWGAMVIIDCGRAFDFLSWYRPLKMAYAAVGQPSLDSLREEIPWRFERPGTCSQRHFRKMELKKIGNFDIDVRKLGIVFPMLRPGTSAAVQDISLANAMRTIPPMSKSDKPLEFTQKHFPVILGIEQLLET